ncbi:MAG: hypothetical protein EOO20_18220 [Chryseobacterium sp.]|nr:MAG: hypothetical protein EOO20_18220 [Chryseobacterium sp.]
MAYCHCQPTWLTEKAVKAKHHLIWRIPLFTTAELAGYITIVFYIDYLLAMHTNILSGSLDTDKKRILMLLWRSLYFVFFSTGYFFFKQYLNERNVREQAERRSAEIMIEKTKAENSLMHSKNAFLTAQINPHLLFNTFEFLHNKIKIIAPSESKLMVYLSEIVRFAAATEFLDGTVKLGDEILQCENLIKIYNITHQKAFIRISYSEDVTELRFIPLVVITLLENILKHGDNSENTKRSGIDIFIESKALKIESFNHFSMKRNNAGFGSGLENIRNRLFYTYGKFFTLVGNDNQSIYRLEISVPLELLTIGPPLVK